MKVAAVAQTPAPIINAGAQAHVLPAIQKSRCLEIALADTLILNIVNRKTIPFVALLVPLPPTLLPQPRVQL